MSDKPFDFRYTNPLEKPLSTDWNITNAQLLRTMRAMLAQLFAQRASIASDAFAALNGFMGESFKIRPKSPVSAQLTITKGLAFQDAPLDVPSDIFGSNGLSDLESYKPLVLASDQTVTVPAADPVNPRIDIIEVRYERRLTDSTSRGIFNTTDKKFDPTFVNKTLTFVLDSLISTNGSSAINYKTGTPAGSPVAPSTSTGYIKIGEILVGAASTVYDADAIKDTRTLLAPLNGFSIAGKVQMPFSGVSLLPTLSNVQAPPGVIVTAVGVAVSGAQVDIYVIAGNTLQSASATCSFDNTYLTNQLRLAQAIKGSGVVGHGISTITVGDQTALQDATKCTHPVKVAVGQPCFKFRLASNFVNAVGVVAAIDHDGKYDFIAAIRP